MIFQNTIFHFIFFQFFQMTLYYLNQVIIISKLTYMFIFSYSKLIFYSVIHQGTKEAEKFLWNMNGRKYNYSIPNKYINFQYFTLNRNLS